MLDIVYPFVVLTVMFQSLAQPTITGGHLTGYHGCTGHVSDLHPSDLDDMKKELKAEIANLKSDVEVNVRNQLSAFNQNLIQHLKIEITKLTGACSRANVSAPSPPGPSLPARPASCAAIQAADPGSVSGEFTVYPGGQDPGIHVWCDQQTAGGSWMVIQRRQDGFGDFSRTWDQYKRGFGYVDEEFWIGNDVLHRLTAARPMVLRIDLWDWSLVHKYAEYSSFQVGDENSNYRLSVTGHSGTAGNALAAGHHLQEFSTKDRDNDAHSTYHCSQQFGGGGWWYGGCYHANLNGRYHYNGNYTRGIEDGIEWLVGRWHGAYYSLKKVEMKIK